MSAWSGLREERKAGRRLAQQIAGLFEQGLERRVVRDERFERRVVRRSVAHRGFRRGAFPLTPILSQRERGLGGAGWRVWPAPDSSISRSWRCSL
ncbi:ABC transporter substrate-binding protein [Pseudomonas denitrificans (nom. rej.)]|uniref:ABC transporter substrate-binding protein n=1 Tax=Pseudomonas denitrificans TaxID=43306 RepID=A0A9X7N7A2_PSEDE|nr:ABC transporter substrate-binding protein [Pseudomonas denitrificans (nom. rej.)]